ncbi:MAG: UvrD-helicase domain-containing protein [Deltaproteobacteria bacterium]|nr:UvrD-helicase domain-containing protein [Deltaproteobacteria bacterium]
MAVIDALEELRECLNPEQFEAATHVDGPTLVLAGAGSGKTRVLVHRLAYLLHTGRAQPWEIFAVTFTNKAAQEMRTRVEALVGPAVRSCWIGTFHGLSARILRLEGERLGYTPNFTIYDAEDAKRLLKRVMQALEFDPASKLVTVAAVHHAIDRAKSRSIGGGKDIGAGQENRSDGLDDEGRKDPLAAAVRRILPRYQEALRQSNAMDFNDLLRLALELLTHHPEARERFSGRFRYIMVDEFQDTNRVQYDLLRALLVDHDNLMVVGDDDQSIYRWRGADVANILGFSRDYPTARVVKLEQNYRSSAHILAAANAVIRRNSRRHEKALWTEADDGRPIGVAIMERGQDEAEFVAQSVASAIAEGEQPADFAVLYRANAQSRLFEEAFRRHGVPYTLMGGTSFFERMEVKDILAYLRLAVNPRSSQDFERIVNTPSRGIGDKTLARLKAAAEPSGLQGALMLAMPDERLAGVGLSPSAIKKLRALHATLTTLASMAKSAPAVEVARAVIDRVDYIGHLEAYDPASADERIENVWELVHSIAEHEALTDATAANEALNARATTSEALTPLAAFLERASLTSAFDLDHTQAQGVALTTLHGAKGLEFPHVFMVGMEEGTFPSRRAVEGAPEDLEEERRLCYVGMTRAMRTLTLIGVRLRWVYGGEDLRWPSRFLGELPDHVVAPCSESPFEAPKGRRSPWVDLRDNNGSRPSVRRRTVERGGDRIEYDDLQEPQDTHEVGGSPILPSTGGMYRPGVRVFHNTLGVGTVESADGVGSKTYLTIRFAQEGLRRVAARFVRSAEESC